MSISLKKKKNLLIAFNYSIAFCFGLEGFFKELIDC